MSAYKNPIADPRAHYGNGPASTRHFITQRVTGLINIAFLLLLLFLVVRLGGQDREIGRASCRERVSVCV